MVYLFSLLNRHLIDALSAESDDPQDRTTIWIQLEKISSRYHKHALNRRKIVLSQQRSFYDDTGGPPQFTHDKTRHLGVLINVRELPRPS